jgi:hypothetical protein
MEQCHEGAEAGLAVAFEEEPARAVRPFLH